MAGLLSSATFPLDICRHLVRHGWAAPLSGQFLLQAFWLHPRDARIVASQTWLLPGSHYAYAKASNQRDCKQPQSSRWHLLGRRCSAACRLDSARSFLSRCATPGILSKQASAIFGPPSTAFAGLNGPAIDWLWHAEKNNLPIGVRQSCARSESKKNLKSSHSNAEPCALPSLTRARLHAAASGENSQHVSPATAPAICAVTLHHHCIMSSPERFCGTALQAARTIS